VTSSVAAAPPLRADARIAAGTDARAGTEARSSATKAVGRSAGRG
jgi:hypothetical protein